MRRSRLNWFLGGLVLGLLGGAAAGILLAPTSGSKTRQVLAQRARDTADIARAFAERAEEAAELLGRQVDHYLGRDEEAAWRKVRQIREGVNKYTQAHQA